MAGFQEEKTQPQAINEDSLVSEVAAQHHLAKWYIYMSKKDSKNTTQKCVFNIKMWQCRLNTKGL